MNDFKLKLQAILDRVKSLANIRKDIQAIEAKLPKIKIKGTLNSTETRKQLKRLRGWDSKKRILKLLQQLIIHR